MSHHVTIPLAPCLLLCLAACSGSAKGPSASNVAVDQANVARDDASSIAPADTTDAVTANNAFAFDLYGHVLSAQTAPGNLLTSPVSASLALTMTYAGAVGTTATQMASALHITNTSTIFDGQNGLSQALASRAATALTAAQQNVSGSDQPAPSPSDYALQVVNSVWGEQTYPWAQPFLTTLAKSYGTGVYVEDFINQWDPAREAINGWVSNETDDKIENLLPEGSLDKSTRMVLVNAIHLKLPWETAFQTQATQNATFTRADASTVSAPFMNQTEELQYVDDGQAQIVAVPLVGSQLSVVFALPHGDLATYEAGLTSLAIPSGAADVELSLPKFTFTSPSFSLADALKQMGMVQAFDPTAATFQGLCPQTPDGETLYIGDVLQKAMIAVQETGVEAAAATAVIVNAADAVGTTTPTPVPVTLNRPFVAAVIDGPTGAILFLGHIEDPTDAGGQ